MKYRNGYDGQVAIDETRQLPLELHPDKPIDTEFLHLDCEGLLTVDAGYAWDYASVPITKWLSNKIQGKKSKTPSLIHDALCQLVRTKNLTMPDARQFADRVFYDMLLERKFWKIRAWAWYKMVKLWGMKHEQEPKKILEAP
jgi:hypothetical protein